MADRSNFWKMVDSTKPSQLRVFGEKELLDCQDYFLEIQSDSTVPTDEFITASERLTLICSEIAIRHSDAKHQQTQRLTRWAIAFGIVSATAVIVFAIAQYVANRLPRENSPATIETRIVATPTSTASPSSAEKAASPAAIETPIVATPTSTASPSPAEKAASPAAIETPIVATPTPTASPSPAEKAASPLAVASLTASPKAKPTSKKAKAKRKARRAARPMPAGRTSDEAANPPAPGGGHGQVWVNTETGVYHREGSRFYGTTRKGKYMTEQDAVQAGYKTAPKRP